MAILSNADRQAIWAQVMHKLSTNRDTTALLKTDLQAALNAADDWVNANRVSYNSALPLAARTTLTPAQKAYLLAIVVLQRFEKGL